MTTLTLLKNQAHALEGETATKISFAAGAIKALGNLLFSRESKSVKLTADDAQGLCLAVESLGGYLEHLASELEREGCAMVRKIEELEAHQ